jgi:hypothetical protein
MHLRPVDLRGALIADCARGRLHDRESTSILALPAAGIASALSQGGPAAVRALSIAIGRSLVGPAREALGGSDTEALDARTPEEVAYGINAALARCGLGRVDFERWGDALVARWHDAPETQGPLAELCAGALATCIGALAAVDLDAVPLSDDGALRVLLSSPAACDHARSLSQRSPSLAAVLADLQPGAPS